MMTSDRHELDLACLPSQQKTNNYQPGYSTVLIQREVKEQLRHFRMTEFGTDTHIERCLITAAIALLLKEPNLHDRWFALFQEAATADVQFSIDYRKNRSR